jgi:hypothetical protein
MIEYVALKLSDSHIKNTNFLNEKAKEGWELISVVSIPQAMQDNPSVHAYMKKEIKKTKNKVING